jgi:hypothetical protein
VVSIGEEAFDGVDFIERVIVPENIQFIEYGAFKGSSIKEIFLPKTLKVIEGDAFNDSSLETIHFATDIQLKEIHNGAFSNSQLTSIAFPRNVEYIGGSAFEYTPLTSVNFPLGSQLNFLGYSSFSNTLLTNVTLPEGLRTIRGDAFRNVATLTSISLPSTLAYIGEYAFAGTGLTSVQFGSQSQLMEIEDFIFGNPDNNDLIPLIQNATSEMVIIGPILAAYKGAADDNQALVIPEGVRLIANHFNLTNNAFVKSAVNFPSTLKYIGDYAFDGATINNDVTFPNMYEIGQNAFQSSTIVGTLTFQDIVNIKDNAFFNTTINEVIFTPTNVGHLVDMDGGIFDSSTIETLRMGEGYLELPSAFTAYSSIKHMFFPDSIKEIRYWAIGSTNLETLTFAGTSEILNVSQDAIQLFYVNSSPWYTSKIPYISLKNYLSFFDVSTSSSPFDVSIPNGITAIGGYAFLNARTFNTFNLNEVNHIASDAFYRWNQATQFPNSMVFDNLKYLGSNISFNFQTLIANGSITFGNNIQFDIERLIQFNFSSSIFRNAIPFNNEGFKILGNMLLQYNPNFDLTPNSVIVPNNIEIISDNAFYGVTFGGPLTLSQNLKWIRQSAFYNSVFTSDITLPEGLLRIDYAAFQESNITSITIPASVTRIESYAFYSNTLNDIEFVDPSNLDLDYDVFGYIDGESIKNVPTRLRKYINGSFLIIDGVLMYYFGYQKQVVIPEGVVNFTDAAFDYRDDSIESIILPSTARYFTSNLFSGLENLINLDFSKVTSINFLGEGLFSYTRIRTLTIAAPVLVANPYLLDRMPYLESYDINLVNDMVLRLNSNVDIVD